ncbi:MAG: hypothetical protein ACYTBV_17850 [Planctomycetota bacterium]
MPDENLQGVLPAAFSCIPCIGQQLRPLQAQIPFEAAPLSADWQSYPETTELSALYRQYR